MPKSRRGAAVSGNSSGGEKPAVERTGTGCEAKATMINNKSSPDWPTIRDYHCLHLESAWSRSNYNNTTIMIFKNASFIPIIIIIIASYSYAELLGAPRSSRTRARLPDAAKLQLLFCLPFRCCLGGKWNECSGPFIRPAVEEESRQKLGLDGCF